MSWKERNERKKEEKKLDAAKRCKLLHQCSNQGTNQVPFMKLVSVLVFS